MAMPVNPGAGIESPAPTRVDLAADIPVLSPALGHPILSRPRGDRFALRDRQGEIDFLKTADFFFHGAPQLIFRAQIVNNKADERK